jgi:hypothetical protein
MCRISIKNSYFTIIVLKAILRLAEFELGHQGPQQRLSGVARVGLAIPRSIEGIETPLCLEPATTSWVCCPTCFCLYDPEDFPEKCVHRTAKDSHTCDDYLGHTRRLKGKVAYKPRREFCYQSFHHWIGRLLCRPDLEKFLDRDVYDTGASPGMMHDIWDGSVLRNLCGPDGKPFVPRGLRVVGRYIFAICMDGFNPFFNKTAGKKYSAGAIYLVCLNLPPELRYCVENVFLACVFPGPKEPSLEQINHVLAPLVDDLLELWDPGVYYTKTAQYATGRLIRAALGPAVCDTVAMHSLVGIGRQCFFCDIALKDIDNIILEDWPTAPTCEKHKEIALLWKEGTVEQRKRLYKKHRIRYSELLRLPYWDPVVMATLDSMHAGDLGDLERQFRVLWGMDITLDDGDGAALAVLNATGRKAQATDVEMAKRFVYHGTNKQLKDCSAAVLKQVCEDLLLGTGGKHSALYQRLVEYVRIIQLANRISTDRLQVAPAK